MKRESTITPTAVPTTAPMMVPSEKYRPTLDFAETERDYQYCVGIVTFDIISVINSCVFGAAK